MKRKGLVIGVVGVALLTAAAVGLGGWYANNRHIKELESQLSELQRQEKRSSVLRSVSSQMEQIAFQQKEISDEQREEALQQTKLANEMRERSEAERRNAITAQHQAMESERKALDAFDQAQQQREIAEQQRIQAEFSKRVADTLSYIALSRSLGSLAITQYRAGNKDLANLLCYAASLYTSRYNGDIYDPTIFQALTLCGQSQNQWSRHDGPVRELEFMPNSDNELVSVSSYGEILHHIRNGNTLKTTTIFKDNRFDFRDLYIDKTSRSVYAVSRTGQLVIKTADGMKSLPLNDLVHPFSIEPMQDYKYLLIIGENSLAKLDLRTNTIVATKKLYFNVTYCSRYNYAPLLFDDKGKMYIVKDIDDLTIRKVPVLGKVTAFASSKGTGYDAYGLENGTIYLIDKQKNIRRLVRHRSRITKLKLNGFRMYSASYDGEVNLWVANSDKIEPMKLIDMNSWIHCFNFDPSKNYIWIGNQKGQITEVLFSVKLISERAKKQLTRNLTKEEWSYFIGKNVPYEQFLYYNRKEGNQ